MNISQEICPACRNEENLLVLRGQSFDPPFEKLDLRSCSQCQLVRVSPFPSVEKLGSYYPFEYYGESNEKKFVPVIEALVKIANKTRAKLFLRYISKDKNHTDQKLLDVGCGRGNFIKYIATLGYDSHGLEMPSFPLPKSKLGLTFHHGHLVSMPWKPQSFDGISLWHVLEHLRDPADIVEKTSELLKQDGIFMVAVPNFGSWQARFFGKHWFHLDLPRHLFQFTPEVLESMLTLNKFEILFKRTLSWEQGPFGFVQSFLNVLFPSQSNFLFSLLKRNQKEWSPKIVALSFVHVFVGALLIPVGLLETVVSGFLGRGVVLIYCARNKLYS